MNWHMVTREHLLQLDRITMIEERAHGWGEPVLILHDGARAHVFPTADVLPSFWDWYRSARAACLEDAR